MFRESAGVQSDTALELALNMVVRFEPLNVIKGNVSI